MTVKARNTKQRAGRAKRLMSLLMAVVLAAGLLPVPSAAAGNEDKTETEQDAPAVLLDDWYQPYVDKLAGWGVMKGDGTGNMRPNDSITRAEYVAMINRAFGYKTVASTPFTDVYRSDWFYDDIGIAYGVGYFNGKAETLACPNDTLTREEAAVVMARNMRLQSIPGESTSFTDGRELSSWSKGLVEAAAREGIISGYADGSFRPSNSISRAEMAAMVARAVGTLIQEPGEQSLGSVYGNLTINTSGVTLMDTVIAGDLYLTGGLGLGAVTLENVTVLGKIVVSGAGEANQGDSSVILRDTNAQELIVDSIANNFVTVRTEGGGVIDRAEVRTRSFIDDVCPSGQGITLIDVKGSEGMEAQFAGNIKQVVDYTPYSKLILTQGRAETVTIDEEAIGATMEIALGATVNTLNLDTGATVNGKGDINRLNVNAAGCIVEMLPDYITIRPGITAVIAGETMDTATAMESSANPRILAGYPAMKDVAPTSATAVFQTNKKGTVYWALTAIADGSVAEEDLINPPVYGGTILQSGNMEMPSSNTDVTIPLTGLLKDGSYYVSAVLVDNRGLCSPVKVAAFTTPDDSTPDFATDPRMISVTHESASVTVMPTKSCQLYYAVLPKGAVAPTISEFKAGAISGNLGYGSMSVVKNTTSTFQVNQTPLEELTDYVLYLLLIDADGSKNSGIKAINFSTPDGTPPQFTTAPYMTDVKKDSITLTTAVNENATIYWVAVPMGEEFPVPQQGQTTVDYSSEYAKICVEKGMGSSAIVTTGSIKATGEKAVEMKLTGLEEATSYDIYYVAKDTAGNYSDKVEKLNESTLDNTPPTAECSFSRYSDTEGKIPLADSDIMVVFSENVMFKSDIEDERVSDSMYSMYIDPEQKDKLVELLRKYVVLIDDNVTPSGTKVPEKVGDGEGQSAWIDYDKIEVRTKDSKLILYFQYDSAIKLASGGKYHFELSYISDTSSNRNMMSPNPTKLDQFTVAFAQIMLSSGLTVGDYSSRLPIDVDGKTVNIDMSFSMTPVSTSSVAAGMCYDMFLWSDLPIAYNLYFRLLDPNKSPVVKNSLTDSDKEALSMFGKSDTLINAIDSNGWICLGKAETNASQSKIAASVNELINKKLQGEALGDKENSFPLNTLNDSYIYEFAIDVTSIRGFTDESTWSDNVEIGVSIPAGANYDVGSLATQVGLNNGEYYWDNDIALGKVTSIGYNAQGGGDFSVSKQFRDTTVPTFNTSYPTVEPGDQQANLNLQLDREGTVYYVVAPVDIKGTEDQPTYSYYYGTTFNTGYGFDNIVDVGENQPDSSQIENSKNILATPTNNGVARDALRGLQESNIKSGVVSVSTSTQTVAITGLIPKQNYIVYLVTQGASPDFSQVYCFRFQTGNVVKPQITVTSNGEKVNITTSENSKDCYWILVPQTLPSGFSVNLTEAGGFYKSKSENKVSDADAYIEEHPDATNSSEGEVCSLISALMNDNKNDTKYSTFDEHAGSNIRSTIQNLIQQGGQGSQGITNSGYIEGPIEGNKTFSIDCTEGLKNGNGSTGELSDGVTYYFIVIMTNSMGEEFSFKAVGNVHKTDSTPPKVTATTGNFTCTGLNDDGDGIANWMFDTSNWSSYRFSGSYAVSFDEIVYLLLGDTSLPDDARRVAFSNSDPNKMKDYIIKSTSDDKATVTFTNVGMSIGMKFENLHMGDSFVFFANGYISDAYNNTVPNGGKLILTFNIEPTNYGAQASFQWTCGNQSGFGTVTAT